MSAQADIVAAEAPDSIRLFGTSPNSIVDGPGLRYAVFVQGCTHRCPGCHNPESWAADGGTLTPISAIMDDIRENGLVHDVTLSGGDPFDQPEASAELARQLKAAGYGLWVYTGYLYEDLLRMAKEAAAQAQGATQAEGSDTRAQAIAALLDAADVLVDGPYVESKRSLELVWKGSSNQRVIDLAATRAAGCIVEWQDPAADVLAATKPESW